MSEEQYRQLARAEPSGRAALGGALIALIEPNAGAERDYNRWYEDDHFHSGAMAAPWIFSGRRWISTRQLRDMQRPLDAVVDAPGGSYLAAYFLTAGHLFDVAAWVQETSRLPSVRPFTERRPLYAGWHDAAFAVVYDPPPMRAELAMDHPYPGLVMEIIDAPDAAGRTGLLAWLQDDFLPGLTDRGQCLVFTPSELPPELHLGPEADPRRVLLLWLVPEDVRAGWDAHFDEHERAVAAAGVGAVTYLSPFIPAVPGTDTHVDEVR